MKTVLVSYEAPTLGAAILEVLTTAGYEVLIAPPSDAIQVSRLHGQVDVLITDYVPPAEGRLDLAGRLKNERPELRVLYAPGADAPLEPKSSLRAPTNATRLLAALATLTDPGAESAWGFCAL